MIYGPPYQVIYADAPWHYNDRKLIRKDGKAAKYGYGACNHYQTMRTADLCVLPIAQIAAPDALLFLWCTAPNDPEKYRVAEAWGFHFVTKAFCWVKTNRKNGEPFFGPGAYSASNTEDCWLFKRGKPKVNHLACAQIVTAPDVLVTSDAPDAELIVAPRAGHSQKPAVVRDRIVALCGDVPRIELFYRGVAPGGWDVWGYEAIPSAPSPPQEVLAPI